VAETVKGLTLSGRLCRSNQQPVRARLGLRGLEEHCSAKRRQQRLRQSRQRAQAEADGIGSRGGDERPLRVAAHERQGSKADAAGEHALVDGDGGAAHRLLRRGGGAEIGEGPRLDTHPRAVAR
jgi:hypothetical protein